MVTEEVELLAKNLQSLALVRMRGTPQIEEGWGDVSGYGNGFAAGAMFGGIVGTAAFGSGATVLALVLLAGHVGGSLRVADAVYRQQKEDMVSVVNKL